MHPVGDGPIGTDDRTIHAGGAQMGGVLGNLAAEQALVLPSRAGHGDEHSRTGKDRCLSDRAVGDRACHDIAIVVTVEQRRWGRFAGSADHGGGYLDARTARYDGKLLGFFEGRALVVDHPSRFQSLLDYGHVAREDRLALGAELLGHLLADLLQNALLGAVRDRPLDVRAYGGDGSDEGDAHHPYLQIGSRGVLLGDSEGIDQVEMDPLLADGFAGMGRQLLPGIQGLQVGLEDEYALLRQPAQRIGVAEDLVIGRDDDLHVLELRVGDLDGLGTQGDVEVGRGTALLGAVLGCGLGVQTENAREDVGEQLAGGDGTVATDRVETDPEGPRRQQIRVVLGLQSHELGFRVRHP